MTKIINGQAAPFNRPVKRQSFNLKYLNTFLLAGILGLGVFYLVLINDLTVQGFVLQNLNSEKNSLASLNMNNQEQANVIQTSQSLNGRLEKLNLVAVANVEYLSNYDSLVAKK